MLNSERIVSPKCELLVRRLHEVLGDCPPTLRSMLGKRCTLPRHRSFASAVAHARRVEHALHLDTLLRTEHHPRQSCNGSPFRLEANLLRRSPWISCAVFLSRLPSKKRCGLLRRRRCF